MNEQILETMTASGFIGFPKHYARREHIVKTIAEMFTAEKMDVVLLEGRSGIGLTAICAEFALHTDSCIISLFIQGGSRLSYVPFRLAGDLLSQVERYLPSDKRPVAADITSEWHARFTQLQENQRRQGKKIYFVVDGLHQIPSEDNRFVKEIFKDLLAVGVPGVKHLIVSGDRQFNGITLDPNRTRPYRLTRLSNAEAERIFKEVGVSPEDEKKYQSYTDGIPALIQSACRLLSAGKSIDGLSAELKSFYDAEWNQLQTEAGIRSEVLNSALAILAFGKGAVGVEEISAISGADRDMLLEFGEREFFIRKVPGTNDIDFLSYSHRQYVAERLIAKREVVISQMIDRLLQNPSSEASMALLPTFFDEMERTEELLDYLSPKNLGTYLNHSRSLTAVRRRTELGMRNAAKKELPIQRYQFSLQTSLIRAMGTPHMCPEQLGALAGMGEIDRAFAQTQIAQTNEERLILLGILVRELGRMRQVVPQAVEEKLRAAVTAIDVKANSPWALNVATDIVSVFPDLALQLVESATADNGEARESAVAQLALNEITRFKGESGAEPILFGKIKNEDMRKFFGTLKTVMRTKSVFELDMSTRSLPSKERIYLLTQWAVANKQTQGSYKVIDLALADLVKDASYLPTASILADLATTLQAGASSKEVEELAKRLEGFKGSLSAASSTIDTIKLDIALAIAEIGAMSISSGTLLEDIYLKISYLPDLAIRYEAMAMLLASLVSLEAKVHIATGTSLKATLLAELPHIRDQLLNDTAEHLIVFEGAFEYITQVDPRLAIDLISKFNTKERRDDAYSSVAENYVRLLLEACDFQCVREMLRAIEDINIYEKTRLAVLELVQAEGGDLLSKVSELLDDACSSVHPIPRCRALAIRVSWRFEAGQRVNEHLEMLRHALTEFDSAANRPREAYSFVQAIVTCDKTEGRRIYTLIENELLRYQAASESTQAVNYLASRLATISFASLIERRLYSSDSEARLYAAIQAVPSLSMQMNLLADLALRAHLKNDSALMARIVSQRIYPTILNNEASRYIYDLLLVEAFAPIYLWNQVLAEGLFKQTSSSTSEIAVGRAIVFLATGVLPNEPLAESRSSSYVLDHPSAAMAVDLLKKIFTDSIFGSCVEHLSSALATKASRNEISKQQRLDLAQKMCDLAGSKLPDQKNIKHNGWRVFCDSHVAGLDEQVIEMWTTLLASVPAVPNCSDRVYLDGIFSKAISEKFPLQRKLAFDRALDGLNGIPCSVDQALRKIGLSNVASGLERSAAERLLIEALDETLKIDDEEISLSIQKKIIDTAQKFDKAFAAKLIDRLDDDPARRRAKSALKKQQSDLKNKEALSNGNYEGLKGSRASSLDMASFQALSGLNAGKLSPPKLDQLVPLLDKISAHSISSIFWGYTWFLRACQQRMQATDDAQRILKPLFEVTLLSCELVGRMAEHASPALAHDEGSGLHSAQSLLIGPGDRIDATSFLLTWVRETSDDDIVICDPYFSAQEIDLIKQFHFERPSARFTILSCKSNRAGAGVAVGLESAWTAVCDQAAPEIRLITVTYDGDGLKGPIHDRWMLSNRQGLRMGTSLNSMGLSKLSEISTLNESQTLEVQKSLHPFISQQERMIDGRRLRYLIEML